MATANEIRTAFLDYFAKNDHQVIESSPLVPRNDPTLMFTNAGMVQFKNVFTGSESRPYRRAATSQKCVRAGGKHNDLENVGYTARHHTFFEMLGNFSFGDYFKERAIELAWNLVTQTYGVAKDRLLVTVYHEDDEAAGHWRKIAGLPDSRIIRIATADNFWAMGDTGPCGPCSEIFFDHGPSIPGGPPGSADADGDRFIEIWNLVFMQFEQQAPDRRVNLPKPSIDTGMGLERISALLQGKHDNYDTDLMRHLILASAELSRAAADGPYKVSHRVVADHLRASAFLIADGVLPANEGRGYVLRRIMRRAMRHAHMMGCTEPLMHRLVPALIAVMGQAYPELVRAKPLITATLELEETRFKQTLERGLRLLDEATTGKGRGDVLAGDVAFRLYDTFGFPLDLTQDALRVRGVSVDTAGFDAAMAKAREAARRSWAGSGETGTEKIWFALRERVGATEFLGYDTERAEGRIVALVRGDSEIDKANDGDDVAVVVNQTPFYGESGGQMGDSGTLTTGRGSVIAIADTQKRVGDLHVHRGKVTTGVVAVGDIVALQVDAARRAALRANHSATHLLHEALRRRLGDHVTQKGSLVAPERLRFDISHPTTIAADDLGAVEADVNARILANDEVVTRLMTPENAVKAGALALFGEKYGDEVRVVAMGGATDGATFSTELCGGTHVRRAGEIGMFHILSESAVAAGVRRIEAVTGRGLLAHLTEQERVLREASAALKIPAADLPLRVSALLDERKRLERELGEARRTIATGGGAAAGPQIEDIGGVKAILRRLDGVPARDLKPMIDDLRKQIGSGVVALVSVEEGKASIVVGVTPDATSRHDAVALVRAAVLVLGGKGGGGRADMAQGGGPDGAKADDALAALRITLQAARR
jgi:alanyl-tRNA synthetase